MLSEEKPSLAFPALLGLTAGFGLWFTYIYGLTLLAMLLFWVWHDRGMLRRPRLLWFALGFLVGFSPWILFNVQNHFAGLVIGNAKVWEHFGPHYLWDGLAHPRKLAPYGFFANIASDDPRDLPRRAVNLLYSVLFLGPILTAGVLRLKTGRSAPAGPRPTRLALVGFGILYVVVFALAVQLSDFRDPRYYLPAYPFLFFLVALSLARCQDMFPLVQRQIQAVFFGSVVVLGLGAHAPLLSLDRPGFALSAKGYAYLAMPETYVFIHAPGDPVDPEFIAQQVQRPFLSDILPKLSSNDQRELSHGIVETLAGAVPFNGQAEDFARLARLVPPGFDRYFYYKLGMMALGAHGFELPKAVAAVEFVRHRSAAAHHLALVAIYRWWPRVSDLERTPDPLVNVPAGVAAELSPHYWRALGYSAGRSWYDTEQSLSQLIAHLPVFVARLEPSVQRYVLQGVGELLLTRLIETSWVPPAVLERFPLAYHQSLLEGWGMALGEAELFSPFPWKHQASPFWMAATKGVSAKSLVFVQQGMAQFDALFEGPAISALEPPRQAP
jgi:hypothetical protein